MLKMKFNPQKVRDVTGGTIARAESTQYDKSRPMGNVAASILGEAVRASLVGFFDQVVPIIKRSNIWLTQAIDEDERFGVNQNLHRVTLNWAKAIGEWLESGCDVGPYWHDAMVYEEAAWKDEARPWAKGEILKHGLSDYMVLACQAGDFEAGALVYERLVGEKKVSLSKVLKPCEYGYALCINRDNRVFDNQEIFEAGKRMLRANLEGNWLGGGQYIRALTWMKTVYSCHSSLLSPLEIILSAYDNMPNVLRLELGG